MKHVYCRGMETGHSWRVSAVLDIQICTNCGAVLRKGKITHVSTRKRVDLTKIDLLADDPCEPKGAGQ